MLFTTENWSDIQRYYENTYLKFREGGDKLFYIENVTPNKVEGILEDKTKFELYLDDEHPYEVDYVLPHKSYFQHGEYACLLQRTPAKQYQRGICNKNTKIYFLDSNGKFYNMDLTFDILSSYVNKPKVSTLEEALTGNKQSCVLSGRFAVTRTGNIFLDSTSVASVNNKSRTIHVKKKLFSPEITELLKTSRMNVA